MYEPTAERRKGTYGLLTGLAAVISSGYVSYVQDSKGPTELWVLPWTLKIANPFKYSFDGRWVITQEI